LGKHLAFTFLAFAYCQCSNIPYISVEACSKRQVAMGLSGNANLIIGGSTKYRKPPDKQTLLADTKNICVLTASSKPVWREVDGTVILSLGLSSQIFLIFLAKKKNFSKL
jgi:hypothetical protein